MKKTKKVLSFKFLAPQYCGVKLLSGNKKINSNAFTLVELIIVIAIIAVLAVAAFMMLTKWLGKSRDSHRLGDLKTIQTGLEVGYADVDIGDGYYPDISEQDVAVLLYSGDTTSKLAYQGIVDQEVANQANLQKVPLDPSDQNEYTYLVTANRKKFQIMAMLEDGSEATTFLNPVYALDYSNRVPTVRGFDLGVLLEEDTYLPIQYSENGLTGVNLSDTNLLVDYIARVEDGKEAVIGTGIQELEIYTQEPINNDLGGDIVSNGEGNTNQEEQELGYICDTDNPLSNIELVEGEYLIGGASASSEDAKAQLFCLSQNQTPEVLSADYKLMADVTFDINTTVTKTYQNSSGNTCSYNINTCQFLNNLTSTVNSNNEDWDGDGNVDGLDTKGWIPLGYDIDPNTGYFQGINYTGNFDGNNKTITNLYINRQGEDYIGFFGSADGGILSNINLRNAYVLGDYRVGLLLGNSVNGSTVSNSSTAGNIAGISGVGGLVGYGSETNMIIDNYSEANVLAVNDAGGLVGVYGNIKNSYATGDVKGGQSVGGLIGFLTTLVENSYAIGNVTGDGTTNTDIGGLVGDSNNGTIKNSYAKGDVRSIVKAGGLLGSYGGTVTVQNSYATGRIYGTGTKGALIGAAESGSITISKSYAINSSTPAVSDIVANLNNHCSVGFDGGCRIEYKVGSIKDGWDDSLWDDLANYTPKLAWEGSNVASNIWECKTNPLDSMVQTNGVYEIHTKDELLCLSQNQTSAVLSADYKLMSDITFDINTTVTKTYQNSNGSTCSYNANTCQFLNNLTSTVNSNYEDWNGDGVIDGTNTEGWIPLGDYNTSTTLIYRGNFNGNNKTITNLYIKRPGNDYQGLFGEVVGGTILNLNLRNVNISGKNRVGGLIGYALGSSTISNCNSTGSVVGADQIGGLIGNAYTSTVTNSYSEANVLATTVDGGGLVGQAGTIRNCYATGDVKGGQSVGGLVGFIISLVENSYATGNVTGNGTTNTDIGGLVGDSNNGTIKNSYASGDVKSVTKAGGLLGSYNNVNIQNSYATGRIYGTGTKGALIGAAEGGTITISNSYAINSSIRAVGDKSSNLSNYCSSGFDSGCNALTINNNWLTTIWNGLSTDTTPTLKNVGGNQ